MMANPFYDLPLELQEVLRDNLGGSNLYVPKRPRITRAEIDRAIREHGGVQQAALSLGISRETIYLRFRKQ